nr:MAG TPA: hypothetical protein [Caudoviricetes sp.]
MASVSEELPLQSTKQIRRAQVTSSPVIRRIW